MPVDASNPLAALRWPHRTRQLLLRPATAADLEAVWSYRRLDEVGRKAVEQSNELSKHRASYGFGEDVGNHEGAANMSGQHNVA